MDRAGLQNEYEILHLIYYKNKRQHHSQRWWKYLRILHRRTKQLLLKFDRQICTYLVRRIIPRAYRYFQSILAQGAFITLGFALLANLAKIWSLLEPHVTNNPVVAKSIVIDREDVGEIIDRVEEPTPKPKVKSQSKPKEETKKKKKKKSKRDAIDDIFG